MASNKIRFFKTMSQLFHQKQISSFPGALPVNIDQSLIATVAFGYVFSLKADGIRVFLMIGRERCVAVGRDMEFVNIGNMQENEDTWYCFDAEMIPNSKLILIFDTLVFRSQSVIREEIGHRFEMAKCFLSQSDLGNEKDNTPKEEDFFNKMTLPSNYSFASIQIGKWTLKVKPIFTLNHLTDVWNHRKECGFEEDGIIFVKRCCEYSPFRENDMSVLKWKPKITLDFMVLPFIHSMDITKNPCVCFIGNVMLCTSNDPASCFSLATFPERFMHKITECYWEKSQWIPIRVRGDKTSPNTYETVLKTLDAIQNVVEFEDFMHA